MAVTCRGGQIGLIYVVCVSVCLCVCVCVCVCLCMCVCVCVEGETDTWKAYKISTHIPGKARQVGCQGNCKKG